ncbi:XRE family transcriptional regulator [Streptomyces sp. CB01881]|uniref:helix-turn-helix domain-containing protein n=1 Tax=Streptomyces sp. CB01881 TaxID=2078691 RepID=UPI000CDBEA1B|nr:XRE family transcriptional regulator [Streptomyces sp. CB01881]AUY51873.1 hypothetical protein C2142_26450 [Streptomyces sp. CB01881]TYC71301.1 XRE family transcriptional regulator [Streptomyces sp. CB01881]
MASAWKQLPDELSGPARRLTEELRAVKDATGLSLSELATRTHYSRASWERWLNGKRVVTEQALDALIGAVECDGPRLRVLWADAVAPENVREPRAGAGVEPGMESVEPGAESVEPGGEPVEPGGEPVPEGLTDVLSGPVAETVSGPATEAADPAEDLAVGPFAGEPSPATPWWRRPVALAAGAMAAAVLLVLAGVRYTHGGGEEPAAVAQPVPTTATATSPAAKPASPAPPASACQAMGCSHKDPKATGCGADARTLQTNNIAKVVIYLRYSEKCQAAWAAITEGEPGDSSTITSSSGETETALIHWGYDNYSLMVNAADPAATFQVCGQQPAGGACTVSASDLAHLVASTPIPIGPASPPTTASPTAPGADAASPGGASPSGS